MGEPQTYFLETLGCPKNQVDSDKLEGRFAADGMTPVDSPDEADIVVVNTCAFIDEARQESVDTILSLSDQRREGAKLVVTGCMAERHGDEIADCFPRSIRLRRSASTSPDPRRCPSAWARPVELRTSICSICPARRRPAHGPTSRSRRGVIEHAASARFRPSGPQRSRSIDQILTEVDELQAREIVLVAQDLAAYGRDQGVGERSIIPLVRQIADRVDRVRLLYLYPSDLTDALIDAICTTGVPYFDLSLQHVSAPLMRRMRRWGDAERFLARIDAIRAREPDAAFRSNFIVGYPGETEADHDALLAFVEAAQLDWCGFFAYSPEEGTYAMELDGEIDAGLRDERLAELRELQDDITGAKRDLLVGSEVRVLVDEPGIGRSHREAPRSTAWLSFPTPSRSGTSTTSRSPPRWAPTWRHHERTHHRAREVGITHPANLLTLTRLVFAPCSSGSCSTPMPTAGVLGGVRSRHRPSRHRLLRRPGRSPLECREPQRCFPRSVGRQDRRDRWRLCLVYVERYWWVPVTIIAYAARHHGLSQPLGADDGWRCRPEPRPSTRPSCRHSHSSWR